MARYAHHKASQACFLVLMIRESRSFSETMRSIRLSPNLFASSLDHVGYRGRDLPPAPAAVPPPHHVLRDPRGHDVLDNPGVGVRGVSYRSYSRPFAFSSYSCFSARGWALVSCSSRDLLSPKSIPHSPHLYSPLSFSMLNDKKIRCKALINSLQKDNEDSSRLA